MTSSIFSGSAPLGFITRAKPNDSFDLKTSGQISSQAPQPMQASSSITGTFSATLFSARNLDERGDNDRWNLTSYQNIVTRFRLCPVGGSSKSRVRGRQLVSYSIWEKPEPGTVPLVNHFHQGKRTGCKWLNYILISGKKKAGPFPPGPE